MGNYPELVRALQHGEELLEQSPGASGEVGSKIARAALTDAVYVCLTVPADEPDNEAALEAYEKEAERAYDTFKDELLAELSHHGQPVAAIDRGLARWTMAFVDGIQASGWKPRQHADDEHG